LSGQFDWWHTAWCISSREKWKEFISRFEKIVGHIVTIGKDIYNEWDMREKEDREREMAERNE